ncbi:MAG: CDP-alcohol phosphatidyltransferase family protein [Proteobacteria bacterium]|nr:CDP-alcohol phosphatidyltransferase family protein [Pseudomonadota bacterium]
MSKKPREGWIIAGRLDGRDVYPQPLAAVAGLPHLLRQACALSAAGIERITVFWVGPGDLPDLSAIAADSRMAGRRFELVTEPPGASGDSSDDAILVVRGDRIFHRDTPTVLAQAAERTASAVRLRGDEHDGAFVVSRRVASRLCAAAGRDGGIADEIASLAAAGTMTEVKPPWRGFTIAAHDRRSLRQAERLLVTSLRKIGDGLMSRWLNRRFSLFLSHYLCRTPIKPNHITAVCFLSALCGGIVMAQGGYAAAVVGILLFEFGSLLDGCDGELSRLKYQGSRLGQWMDTVTDDAGNVFFLIGASVNLHQAGIAWALPVGAIAVIAFVTTQSTQYYFLLKVYDSGDLAAIPWAFQGPPEVPPDEDERSLLHRIVANLPKVLRRDFFLSVFVVLVIAGRLDAALLIFATGATIFFAVLMIQIIRLRPSATAGQ